MTDNVEAAAQHFQFLAQDYCTVLTSSSSLDKHEFLSIIFPSLAKVIGAAAALPIIEPYSDSPISRDVPAEELSKLDLAIRQRLDASDTYSDKFDPTENEEVVQGSLANDLVEIYQDVKGILLALENGATSQDAVWEWRLDFETHWGRHAVQALRVIHHLLT